MTRMIRSSSRRARRCPGTSTGTLLLMVAAALLPIAGQASPAVNGPGFGVELRGVEQRGGALRQDGAAFFRIEQFPARFGQVRPTLTPTPAPARTARSGLAAIGTPLLTAGTLLHSAFVDALDPTSGLARPALLPDGSAAQLGEPSSFARSYGIGRGFGSDIGPDIGPDIARDIDGSSAFRLIDSERRAAASSAPVLGLRIGERTSLRVQMGGMETREEDGFAGGLRFEYVP